MNFVTLGGKEYDLATITFSPESIELIETIEQVTDIAKNDGQQAAKLVLKAIRLMYSILKDCLIRGGNDEQEVVQALAKVNISLETIQDFLKLMIKMD